MNKFYNFNKNAFKEREARTLGKLIRISILCTLLLCGFIATSMYFTRDFWVSPYSTSVTSPLPSSGKTYTKKSWKIGDKVILNGCAITVNSIQRAPEIPNLNNYNEEIQYYIVKINLKNNTGEDINFNNNDSSNQKEPNIKMYIYNKTLDHSERFVILWDYMMSDFGVSRHNGFNKIIPAESTAEGAFYVLGRANWESLRIEINSNGWIRQAAGDKVTFLIDKSELIK